MKDQTYNPANDFDAVSIRLASPDRIREWSFGEVTKPETINYRTQRAEKNGLFDEKIFGPTRDFECFCGKYKGIRYKGIVCDRCGVEITRNVVRRERGAHIELASPVAHIWFLRGIPSRIATLLGMSAADVEKVVYFSSYIITKINEKERARVLNDIDTEFKNKSKSAANDTERKRLKDRLNEVKGEVSGLAQGKVLDESMYHTYSVKYGTVFEASIGAEAIFELFKELDVAKFRETLMEAREKAGAAEKIKLNKRIALLTQLMRANLRPEWMFLTVLPVSPPALRPMVALEGGRHASSDVNDLYRRVINRNNRLRKLMDIKAPEVILRNEKRILQEAVDALIDNSIRHGNATGAMSMAQRRPLKSLSDYLKGKQGYFRQNLLGKRVDYSGRSVIVVGPELKLDQCGLPKHMALELFRPFIIAKLLERELAYNIRGAGRLIEEGTPEVWAILEEVTKDKHVLLNRAPTLHRLGIQAFRPVLIEGNAIRIHPLVCPAFNADFDGDQMAVHLPLSAEAQAEARVLMLATNNILSPATGRPIASPTQDMVLGIYWLTYSSEDTSQDRDPSGLPIYGSIGELERALDDHHLSMQDAIVFRLRGKELEEAERPAELRDDEEAWEEFRASGQPFRIVTTPGRVIFNEALPQDYPYVNEVVTKKDAGDIVNKCSDLFPRWQVVEVLDAIKDLGYHNATRAGVTVAISDVETPALKTEVLAASEERAGKIEKQFSRGVITDSERRQELIEIWTDATSQVAEAMEANFTVTNPFFAMANSGARGNMTQLRQIAAMRGLVANPKGEIIPRPIKSNYREGLSVLEYFIATHGARKGLADTALRTADSGYLTRRLVDVSQDLIVREEDCGTERGIDIVVGEYDSQQLYGRVLAKDVTYPGRRKVVLPAGTPVADTEVRILRSVLVKGLDPETGEELEHQPTDEDRIIKVRAVLACETEIGVCRACYGELLANGAMVDMGEAVGIVAAQSIGEPGTQLTMRTFHTGGVASAEDITQGLPRVVELFEARSPRGKAEIARLAGRVEIEDGDQGRILRIKGSRDQVDEHELPRGARLFRSDDGAIEIADGVDVEVGQQLTVGAIDPHELLDVLGVRASQLHLVKEVQDVYRSQGVPIHDKHVELIVRQMYRRVNVVDPGDTIFLPGDNVDRVKFNKENDRVLAEGGQAAAARPLLMGITKASLATDSWLSAASFQETTRVLTEAALESASDPLVGLKENVIIGKLIPAGTGIDLYRNVEVAHTEMPEQALPADIAEFLASTESYEGDGSWGFEGGWGFEDFPGDVQDGSARG